MHTSTKLFTTLITFIVALSTGLAWMAPQGALSGTKTTCSTLPLPSGITFLGGLNDGSTFTNGLGNALNVQRMTLGTTDVLVVAVGQNLNGSLTVEVYFVDPNTGTLLDGTNIGSDTAVQPHISTYVGFGIRHISGGDVNSDGIPDFALGSPSGAAAIAMVGTVSNGILNYQVKTLTPPPNTNSFGASTAMGDLDGIPGDEIAVGATGGGNGGSQAIGKVAIFAYDGIGFTNTQTISSPIPNARLDDLFGCAVAIANITGSASNDLVVGASGSTVNGISGAGRVYVFPGPVNASNYQTLTTGIKGDQLGSSVATGNVDGGVEDVIAATSDSSSNTRANVYSGPTTGGQSPGFTLQPIAGRTGQWFVGDSRDLNGDGLDDVILGADVGCGGTAYLSLSSGSSPLAIQLALQTPVFGSKFGSSVAIGPGTRLFFVGDSLVTVGSTFSSNGQVYVFKVN
jgi:hypothetical protein